MADRRDASDRWATRSKKKMRPKLNTDWASKMTTRVRAIPSMAEGSVWAASTSSPRYFGNAKLLPDERSSMSKPTKNSPR